MTSGSAFTRTAPELLGTLEELIKLEPLFHTPEFGSSVGDYERRMASDYWEVGASGRRYSREFILRTLDGKGPANSATWGWVICDQAVRQLATNTYLLTYTLLQDQRKTRRATVWQRTQDGWIVLYHQGTLVSIEEDDVDPR
jgi:hypothetical protein